MIFIILVLLGIMWLFAITFIIFSLAVDALTPLKYECKRERALQYFQGLK